MINSEVYVAGDYGGFRVGNVELYYGYECTNEKGEWCFYIKTNRFQTNPPVIWSWKELGAKDQFDVTDCLLRGIARLMSEGKLVLLPKEITE